MTTNSALDFATYNSTANSGVNNGFQLTNEFRVPSLGDMLTKAVGLNSEEHKFVPFVFVDYGAGWSHLASTAQNIAMTMVPTTPPRKTMSIGSMSLIRPPTATSTSSS